MSAPFRDPNEPISTREQELRDSVSLWASKRNRRQLDAYTETSKINPIEFSNLNRAVGAEQARSLVGTPRGADLVRKSATFDDLTQHLSRAPKLDRALEFDPDLLAVAHNDISTLASIEETLRGGVKTAQLIGGQVRAGVVDMEAAVLGSNEFHSSLLGLEPLTGEQASDLFLAQFKQQSASQELAQAELGEVGTAFATIARASPQLTTGIGAFLGGTLVGGPLVGIALTAAQSYVLETGSVYNEWTYGEDPIDPDLQKVLVPAYGIFAATVETIAVGAEAAPIKHALKQAMKAGAKNKALRLLFARFSVDLFRNAIIEGGEETVQEAANIFLSTFGRHTGDPDGFVKALLSEETLTRLLQAFKGGATVGVGVGGVRTGLGARTDIRAARNAAEQEKQFGQDLAEGVSKAEMLDHSPAKFKNLLFQMTEGTPQEDVWIDADTFLDHFSKPENAQALDDLRKAIPDIDEQILEAQNTGSDIVMKTADFATHIAATQHLDGLSDGLRFDPDAPTLAALNQEATERETEALEAEIEREAGALETDELIEVSESAVTTLTDRAVDDLKLTRREAEAFATVKVANLMTLAQTENLDPAAFLNAAMGRLPLQRREDVPGTAEFAALQEGVEPLAQPTKEKELPRGFFARFEGGGGLLALTSRANKSTVFHELSHDMFSVMQALAQRSEASPDLQADWAILRDWLGANDQDALTDAQEEVLAETMEVYFEEGNAPTPELQSVFDRISRWMTETYRRVRGRPNADINDDVRAVFERMFATQDAIEAAKADLGFQDVFEGRKPEGMTEAAWARAQARVRNVESEINERAGRRVLKAKLKEVNAAAVEARNAVRETVTQQLWDDPAYRARSWLRTGKLPDGSELPAEHLRLSWEGILEVLSDLPETEQQERLAALKLMRLTKKDGMHPEVAAQALGLDDATEMLDLVEGTKDQTLAQAIKAETERQMQEQHPELLVSQEELKAQAEAAILDVDSRVKHMEQTIKALRKLDAESPGRAAAERAAVTTPLGIQEAERRLQVAQRTLEDATRREDVQRGLLTRLAVDVRQAEERLRIERRRARRERMAATEAQREERARGREALREQRGAAAEAITEERRQSRARLSEIRQGAALATQGLNVGAIRVAAAARVESTSGRKLKSLVANFRGVSQKKTKEAVRTAGRGDYGDSANALETVILANEIVRRGNEAMIRRDKGQRKLVPMTRPKFQGPKLSETKNPSEASRHIWAHTFNLLDRYELRKTTKDVRAVPVPRDTDGKNFQTFRQDYVEATGELWKGPEFLDDSGHQVHYLDLAVNDFDGLMEGITNLQTWANALTRISKEEGKQSFLEANEEMIGDATAFGTGRSIHIPKGAGSVAERAAKAIDAIYGTINRPIFGFRLLDRQNIQGSFKLNIVDPLKGGAFFRLGFMKDRQEQQNDLFESVYRPKLPEGATTAERLQSFQEFGQISRRFMSKTLAGSREIAGIPLTRNNLIQIMIYWGSPESRAALENADESPMSEEVVMRLIGKYATKQDRDYVEGIWALPEQDWSAISELHMRLTGTPLRKVEALPFTTPQGWEMSGGYSRMFYESEFSQSNIKKAENKDTLSALTYKGSMTIQTPHGQRKHRKGNAGNQLMLTHTMVWNRQLNETASDLAYAEVVPKVMRFINDKAWRRAVSKALGAPFVQKLHNWVETSVAPQYQPDVAADIWVDRARQAGVMQIIGGRASTVLIQFTGIMTALPKLGKYTFIGMNSLLHDGWARGASRPESGAGPHRFFQAMNQMIELSPPLQFRRQTYDQNANDFISRGKFPSGMSLRFVQWYAGVIGYVDSLVAGSVWAGAYQQAMDGDARAVKEGAVEGDHDLAVKYANDLMEVTQGGADSLDLAAFMRSKNPLWRSLFSFGTFVNNRMNLTIEEFSIANQTGGFADWWRFSTYIASAYILDAAATVTIGYLIAGLRPEEEPRDPDEIAERFAWSLFSNFNAGYPGASQMNSLLRPVVFGGQIRKLDLGPAGDAAQQPFIALQAAVKASRGEEEWEKAFIEGVHTVGYWYNAPTQNMVDFAEMVLQTEIDKK